jgi:hypothetical protein
VPDRLKDQGSPRNGIIAGTRADGAGEQVPAPDEWARTFTDPRLCAAIVDRLTFDASIIETGTDSFRLRTTKGRRTSRAS